MYALGEAVETLTKVRTVKKTAQRGKSESLFYGIAIAAMEVIKAHIPDSPDTWEKDVDGQDETWKAVETC